MTAQTSGDRHGGCWPKYSLLALLLAGVGVLNHMGTWCSKSRLLPAWENLQLPTVMV